MKFTYAPTSDDMSPKEAILEALSEQGWIHNSQTLLLTSSKQLYFSEP